jgi:hypothetical protein
MMELITAKVVLAGDISCRYHRKLVVDGRIIRNC